MALKILNTRGLAWFLTFQVLCCIMVLLAMSAPSRTALYVSFTNTKTIIKKRKSAIDARISIACCHLQNLFRYAILKIQKRETASSLPRTMIYYPSGQPSHVQDVAAIFVYP